MIVQLWGSVAERKLKEISLMIINTAWKGSKELSRKKKNKKNKKLE